jgi:exodeoxyribonuclease VII large subunit
MFESLLNSTPKAKTVTELTNYLRGLIEGDFVLQGVWVSGEVSNMTVARSGHWYFTLKDATAQLRCVMWKSSAVRQSVTPRDGDALEVYGRMTLYEARGEYQLQAERVRPVGMGDLYLRFEELKARLQSEGLFEEERKRPLPVFPARIGIVTSPDAAAFHDVQNVLRRRFPIGEVVLSPTPVQGAEAAPQIVNALNRLNDYGDVDVIMLIRGGGSLEDLWCFNDEKLARAVVNSRIPVVTGVGHEVDFTIVDFVSDHRAPTPSAAAEVITQYCAVDDLRDRLLDNDQTLEILLSDQIAERRDKLRTIERSMRYNSPEIVIRNMRQQIDSLDQRITRNHKAYRALLHERLNARSSALRAADPQALLSRGYARVTLEDGTPLRTVQSAPAGTRLHLQLTDGQIDAISEGITSEATSTTSIPKPASKTPKPTTDSTENESENDHDQPRLF